MLWPAAFAWIVMAFAGTEDCDPSSLLHLMKPASLYGWDADWPQDYNRAEIESLVGDKATNSAVLQKQHAAGRARCQSGEDVLESGGFCYTEEGQRLISTQSSAVDEDFWLPKHHVMVEPGFASGLAKLVLKDSESVTDLGAGVGQLGHALKAEHSNLRYYGYDGAGNVEEYTGGYVKFANLGYPTNVAVSDWVVCLEVGEHIPHENEKSLIANIHAHNRKGVVLSWAHLLQAGHAHVNCHSAEYLRRVFEGLGYKYDNATSQALRETVEGEQRFYRENVMIFRRP
ncbi:unnamed protein product [Effrenium voratum]|uniref:Rhodanese domain-containing protein n=1 Tax=Effrenium voratum TaxID=2562239 RepID=A0AA36N4P2_9DINO|nr:unnamed protein product [Effrenium voratum]